MSEIPNPNEWLLISDVEYDNFSGQIDSEKLYMKMKTMLVCQKCKRLLIFWSDKIREATSYKLED
ncbi:MAG: hypothetical protein GY830_02745 [Bacteroidetes bacterium]|nr:hypothetical protein [Bacteroidota bacterium]